MSKHPNSLANLKPIKPGETRNPGGKPVAARNQLSKLFLNALVKDFEADGKGAIANARETDPMGYVRAIASILPKEFIIERPLDGLSDDELTAAIADLRARLHALDGAGEGMGEAEVGEPTRGVQTLQ